MKISLTYARKYPVVNLQGLNESDPAIVTITDVNLLVIDALSRVPEREC